MEIYFRQEENTHIYLKSGDLNKDILTCLFENILHSIDNENYLLNTEPMQIGITRNFYITLHSRKQAN